MLRLSKKLGQNFLKDDNILRQEVAFANVGNRTVLEIGPGDGRLTEKILDANPKHLTAVEKDSRFAAVLREKFKAHANVEIIEGDFLETDFSKRKFDVIIGNIPYYISSAIVFSLPGISFERAFLMVQKEFAEKMVAKPNESNYGRLSVTAQLNFSVKYLRTVPKGVFVPVPKVDSALIELTKNDVKISAFDEDVVRFLFQHKNQTVRNALIHSKKFSKEELEKPGDYLKRKVRTLTKEECLEISKLLK
jgi:16S rRNA (adenine1518-N6/adenine1519-N6)-dimethyltransferase